MNPPSITDLARRYVADAIFNGKFKPGDQVKEETVAGALGISRPPVREAFKMLESEGLLKRLPRRGVFVTDITDKDAMEIYTLKAELYAFSIQLCFHRLSPDQIGQMGRIVDAMEESVRHDPPGITAYQELNVSFHNIHVDMAEHQRLKQILNTLHNQARYFSLQNLLNRDHLETSCRYHRRIFDAFQMGDREAAMALSREHVLVGLKRFQHDSPETP